MAVVTSKQPERIPDLLGYQALILEARMEYDGDGWLGYDRRFRQRAAADTTTVWARIDPPFGILPLRGKPGLPGASTALHLLTQQRSVTGLQHPPKQHLPTPHTSRLPPLPPDRRTPGEPRSATSGITTPSPSALTPDANTCMSACIAERTRAFQTARMGTKPSFAAAAVVPTQTPSSSSRASYPTPTFRCQLSPCPLAISAIVHTNTLADSAPPTEGHVHAYNGSLVDALPCCVAYCQACTPPASALLQ